MDRKKFTADEVIAAVAASKGVIKNAAESLGCDRSTVYRYIEKYKTVQRAVEDARENLLDHVENKLHTAIDQGNMTAIIFFLKTQGKGRGYVERLEIDANVKLVAELITALKQAGIEPDQYFAQSIDRVSERLSPN